MTLPPESGAAQDINTSKAVDTLLADQTFQLDEIRNRLANLEANEGAVVTQIVTTLYDNTLSGNGSWNIQNSNLIAGVGNLADYDMLEVFIYGGRSTAAVTADNVYLLFGTGGGALDTTATNYDNEINASGTAARADTPRIATIAGANADSNMFTDIRIEVYFPGSSKFKNSVCTNTNRVAAATHQINILGHSWENTGAIDRIGIRTDNDPTDLILSGTRMVILGYTF